VYLSAKQKSQTLFILYLNTKDTIKVQIIHKQTHSKTKQTYICKQQKSPVLEGFVFVSYKFSIWLFCTGYFPIQKVTNPLKALISLGFYYNQPLQGTNKIQNDSVFKCQGKKKRVIPCF
jgi:hypothetical protein